ncbi:hypothetical protein [Rhodopseudomonas palustris]|uniref:Uncharacterized FAD-dependent dehydrogenases-like n=1 Tax=Rhodopseudomonas palustris (strain BisB18) TaxID=316056 RepID=Q214G8_RHOPB
MNWDYVFIGAGPASLIAAGLLSKSQPGACILILEAGGTLKHRGCPGMRRRTCTDCSKSGCRVTMGVGGSSAGFGNKMCRFPASSETLSLVPQEVRLQVEDIIAQLLGRDPGPPEVSEFPVGTVRRKFYSADVLFRSEYGALIAKLLAELSHSVELRSDAAVASVQKGAEGFELQLASGEKVKTSKLVLGTGRSGHKFIRRTLDSLGVSYVEAETDVGIRLEARTGLFSESFFYQNDPKFKVDHGELGTSRTFCACRGGHIVPVKFGNGFFADGAFVSGLSDVTNVALMVRSSQLLTSEQLDEWCRFVNVRSGQSLLLGEVSAEGGPSAATILASVPVWPSDRHKSLMAELLDAVVAGKQVDMFGTSIPGEAVKIYGPAVDRYWPLPSLSTGFQTNVEGLSIIGDAAGLSRGIVQALASGVGWALVESVATGMLIDEVLTHPNSSKAA